MNDTKNEADLYSSNLDITECRRPQFDQIKGGERGSKVGCSCVVET